MYKKNIPLLTLTLAASMSVLFASCKKKKEEAELITTVEMKISKNGGAAVSYVWKDTDGAGGADPVTPDSVLLDSGATYQCELFFRDESNGQSTDITGEIRVAGMNHLICFTATPPLVDIQATDSDGTYPIGLQSNWKAVLEGDGLVRVVLRHQPGSKNGSCDQGETDVDVAFPLRVR